MGVLNQPVPRMTKVGSITMTMPAFLVILFATILFSLIAITAILSGKPKMLVGVILMYAFAVYGTYVINCLTVGSCNLLAWIIGILYAVIIGLAILGYVASIFTKGMGATVANYKPGMIM